ncbi:recombinase family protein [Methylobacterium sp. D54C]
MAHDPDRDIFSDEVRPGIDVRAHRPSEQLLAAVLAGEYRHVVIEDGDCRSRDDGDTRCLAGLVHAAGAELHSTTCGTLHSLGTALDGRPSDETPALMALRADFSRRRRAEEGLCMGGIPFGYDRVAGWPGRVAVNVLEAEHVRWIYRTYLDGTMSPTQIARDLQGRGVPPCAMADTWDAGTVRRILANPMYRGLLIYGRRQAWRDPADGRWRSRVTDPRTWIVTEVPGWQIVGRETWERVQSRIAERRVLAPGAPFRTGLPVREGTSLLAGRIRCPSCWDGFHAVHRTSKGRSYIRCNRHDPLGGGCPNGGSYPMRAVEAAVVRCVGDALADDAGIAAFTEARARTLHERRRVVVDDLRSVERRIAEMERDLDVFPRWAMLDSDSNLARAVAAIQAELADEWRLRRQELSDLGSASPRSIGIDPGRLGGLRDAILGLAAMVPFRPVDEAGYRLRSAFREFVTGVILHPGDKRGEFRIEVTTQMGEPAPTIGRT